MSEQPKPIANEHPALWPIVAAKMQVDHADQASCAAVVADMSARHQVGMERYGVPLQPHNGRDALRDMYEELLDARVYWEQVIVENRLATTAHGITRSLENILLCISEARQIVAKRGKK